MFVILTWAMASRFCLRTQPGHGVRDLAVGKFSTELCARSEGKSHMEVMSKLNGYNYATNHPPVITIDTQ